MQVLISVSHLNPCDISATPSSRKLHLSSIQDYLKATQNVIRALHPSQFPSPVLTADHKIFVSTPSMYFLTSGNVHELTSHLHVASRLHPDADIRISSPSK